MTAESANRERAFWNEWNSSTREVFLGRISREQQAVVLDWLEIMSRMQNRRDFELIDVGCGAGWLCDALTRYGRVVGTDLSDEVLARAAARVARAEFIAGDFMELDFGRERFDVAVSLEVLSHVADQPAFLAKIASLLKPGGVLMLATQNRPVLMKNNIPPPGPGQRRHWVDKHELRELLSADFEVQQLLSITPKYDRGLLRYVNSDKAHRILRKIGLGFLVNRVIRMQEGAWMGWTLMALVRKR
jgi:2-polyprenyl-3-methyl-5-hydroxy-6-metoxy-1,4-benzoquinol methylase